MHRTSLTAVLSACLLALPALAERPRIPNSVKYSDSGTASARGRAGSASIETRALIGKDGQTAFDVTTGTFDQPGAGALERLQVKVPTTGDDLTYNYNGLSGGNTFSTSLSNLVAGATLRVQAHVSGIDPNRTDVVAADVIVKRRPDLEVSGLAVMPHGVMNRYLRVTALVSEKNGDVGARADCVLYEGTRELRRTGGIWVDAGSSVTCSFSHAFDSAGAKALRVTAEQVSPGDYDDSNNSDTGQTQIYSEAHAVPQWWGFAQEFRDKSMHRAASSTFAYYRETEESRQFSIVSGTVRGPLDMQSLRISGVVETDGETMYVGDEIESEWFSLPPWWSTHGGADFYGDGFDGYALSYGTGADQVTDFDLRRVGGEVTYHNEGFELGWNGYYSWNESGSFSRGYVARPYGSTVAMEVALSDGSTYHEVRANMPMRPFADVVDVPEFCYDHPYFGPTCMAWRQEISGSYGYDDQSDPHEQR